MATNSIRNALAAALAALLPCVAVAQAARPAPGSYVYTLIPDSSDDIKLAVNQTVEHMSFITRPVARGRLNKTNPTPKEVHVVVSADTLAVTFDAGNPVATPFNGDTVPYTSTLTNERYTARFDPVGDSASQTIASKDGVKRLTYAFPDSARRLRIHVTVTSPRLPGPLNYQLLLMKKGEGSQ
jgi:hypothetical protein